MSSYFDSVIDQIQRQRWHGQCSASSLEVLASVGMHQAILRLDGQVAEAVKLCLLRNLRGVDEPLTADDAAVLEGRFPSSVLTVGRTPVMTAIWTNSMEALRLLRNAGASFTLSCVSDASNTALHYACMLNRADMVSYIIPLLPKASLLQRNAHGDTPLHSAARNGHFELLPLFISRGEKFYEDDVFVWRQLHKAVSAAEAGERSVDSTESSIATEIQRGSDKTNTARCQQTTPRSSGGSDAAPPPGEVIRRILLGRSHLDGSTILHLVAKIEGSRDPERMLSLAATLEQLLDAARRHHCLVQALTAVDKSGDTSIVACRTRVVFDVLSSHVAACALRWRWSTAPAALLRVCDDDDEDLAFVLASGITSTNEVPVLSPSGETPLHRLIASSTSESRLLELGSDGLLTSWLDVLASIYPLAANGVTFSSPAPVHDVRFAILSAADASGYSAWTRLCSTCGVASSLAKEMIAADVARYPWTNKTCHLEDGRGTSPPTEMQQQRILPLLPNVDDWLRLPLLTHNARDRRNVLHHTARLGDGHGMKWLGAHVVGAVLGELRTRLGVVETASIAELRRFQAAVAQRKEAMAAAAAAASAAAELVSPSTSVSETKSGSFPSPAQPAIDSAMDIPFPSLEDESALRQCVPLLEHATRVLDAVVCTVDHEGFSPLRTAALHNHGLVVDEIVAMTRQCNAFVHDVLAVMLRHALVAAQHRRILDDAAAQKTKRSTSITSVASPQLAKSNSFAGGSKSGAAAKRQSFASKEQLVASASLVEPAVTEVALPAVVAAAQALDFLRTFGLPPTTKRDAAIVAALLPPTPVDSEVDLAVLTSQLPLPCGGALCLEILAEGHPIRRAVTVVHQAAEAGSHGALASLIRAAVVPLKLAAEMEGNDRSTVERKAAAGEVKQVAFDVCRRLLKSPGADENQGRNVLHIAVHLGDVRSVDAILRSLAEGCTPSCGNPSALTAAEAIRRSLTQEILLSTEASSGAYVSTPSLNDAIDLWCSSRQPQHAQDSSNSNRNSAAASPLKGMALSALMQFPPAIELLELHDALIGSSLRRDACCLPVDLTVETLASLGVTCHPMVGVEASNLLRSPCRAFLLRETLWRWIPSLLRKCPEILVDAAEPASHVEERGGAEESTFREREQGDEGAAQQAATTKLAVDDVAMGDTVSEEIDVTPRPELTPEGEAT